MIKYDYKKLNTKHRKNSSLNRILGIKKTLIHIKKVSLVALTGFVWFGYSGYKLSATIKTDRSNYVTN